MQPTNEQIQIQTYKVGKAETRTATNINFSSIKAKWTCLIYFLVGEDDH